ncbi:hypothetical protein [Maricaulis sp.]|uniref:hypothetical protein n=1 Tax=Maricaulis sp. TaxID=1486257 RepID=UPI002603E952|nr:hypothetical protein [Maricaulis sp.]
MLRTLINSISAAFVVLAAAGAAHAANVAGNVVCQPAPLLLQDVTIMDASGRWDDQDIFIENGRISAIGEGLLLETRQVVTVFQRPGAVVRPRPARQAAAIFIRTSNRSAAPSPRETVLMPGAPADLLVFGAATAGPGQVELEIRAGRIVGALSACNS